MNLLFSSIYLLLSFFSFSGVLASKETLRFSQVIFRHGERNTDKSYGKYTEEFDSIWPEGLSALTDTGKKQALELGHFFRNAYDGHLSRAYLEKELHVLSSTLDRTIQTAAAVMMGLYEDYSRNSSWTREMRDIPAYEPIPVRTIPEYLDNFLALKVDCPRREEILDNGRGTIDAKYFQDQDYKDIYEYALLHAGQPSLSNPNATPREIHNEFYQVVEVMLSLSQQHKPLEDWMLPLLSNNKFLSYKYFLMVEEHAIDKEAQRLNAGPLVQLILENNRQYLEGSLSKRVIFFSAHDKTLMNFMWALNISSVLEEQVPPFASALAIELHKLPEYEELVVQFWYRNGGTDHVESVISPKCGDPCTLQKLYDFTSDLFPVDYDEECKIN